MTSTKYPQVTIECNQQYIPDFPEVLFGTHNNKAYFNASHIITNLPNKNVDNFLSQHQQTIQKLSETQTEPVILTNNNNQILLSEILLPSFLGYINPEITIWGNEMILRIMNRGFAFSDGFILESAMEQLDLETIQGAYMQKRSV